VIKGRFPDSRGHSAAASLKPGLLDPSATPINDSRGHSAAASLKLDRLLPIGRDADQFPRPFGRGLIEALARRIHWRAKVHSRGHSAAASLKPCVPISWLAVGWTFPRPFGRGLIEAVRPR